MKLIATLSVVSLFAVPAVAQESIAQAAERQKKARRGQTKVITDDDLRNTRSKAYSPAAVDGAPAQPAAVPGPAAAAEAPAAKSDDQLRAEKKAELQEKMKQWSDFIAETKKAVDQAQSELNNLSAATFGNRRAGLQKIVEEGNAHIAEAQQSIAELQEQARRSGIGVSR